MRIYQEDIEMRFKIEECTLLIKKNWRNNERNRTVPLRRHQDIWKKGNSKYLGILKADTHKQRECPRGVMVKAMDCKIVVSEFELQLRYYVHFRTNMTPLFSRLWVK